MEFYWVLKVSNTYVNLERLGSNPALCPKEGYPTGRPELASPAGQALKPEHLLRVWFFYTVPLPRGCLIFVLFAHILALLQKLSWPLKREDVYHAKNKSIIWVETRHELGLSGVASWQPFKLTSFNTSVIALHGAQKNVCKHKEVQPSAASHLMCPLHVKKACHEKASPNQAQVHQALTKVDISRHSLLTSSLEDRHSQFQEWRGWEGASIQA